MSKRAGHGDPLLMKLRLTDGEEVLFVVDTGAPGTILDSTLEPKLGKRLGTKTFHWIGQEKEKAGKYKCPELFLGKTPLLTGGTVLTTDLIKKFAPLGHPTPIKGLIGTDILRRYCIQLDFEAGKMRFLDPDLLRTEDLGNASRLSIEYFSGYPVVHESFLGKGGKSIIDTGCNFDGLLTTKLFQQWTNGWPTVLAGANDFPNGQLAGLNYTNLFLEGHGGGNLIGLSFLARNLVTLNFPKRTMYLRQRSVGPLAETDRFFKSFFYPKELRTVNR
jgi:hypothetical protein